MTLIRNDKLTARSKGASDTALPEAVTRESEPPVSGGQSDWSLYRSFLTVVRTGSLSAASRALAITQPTVGRHIAALERSLGGKPLFTRSQNGLLPTDVARELLPHAEVMASAADAFMRAASARTDEMAGVIRLSATNIVGAEVLPTMLTEFHDLHPNVAIELGLTNETVDLLRRDADIAVRMIKPSQKALVARKVGTVGSQLYATRGYLQKYGVPSSFDDLRGHAAIGYDALPPPARIMKTLPPNITREMFTLRSDSDLAQLAALRAGFGIGACQIGIARRHPELEAVLTDEIYFEMDVWVVMHEGLKKVQRVRLMFDHLVKRLKAYTDMSVRG